MKMLIAMLGLMVVACSSGGGGSAQTWEEPCVFSPTVQAVARHDFGTTDLGVLGRVVAYQSVTDPSDDPFDGGTWQRPLPLTIQGSVVAASCGLQHLEPKGVTVSADVTFVLDP